MEEINPIVIYKQRYKPVTHVIFELDEILLRTASTNRKILKYVLRFRRDIPIKRETIYKILGRQEREALQMILDDAHVKNVNVDDVLREYMYGCKQDFPTCPFMPGAKRLVRYFYSNKIPMAIATSTCEDNFYYKITSKYNFFRDHFHHYTFQQDTSENIGKPSPDIYRKCIEQFKDDHHRIILPCQCLAFESSPAGVDAALAAGCQVVMVPDSFIFDPELTRKATVYCRTLHNFWPEEFGLPSYCRNCFSLKNE